MEMDDAFCDKQLDFIIFIIILSALEGVSIF